MTAWYAYPHPYPTDGHPRGSVEQVTVLHEEGDGTAIVRHAYGHVSTCCGPFCPGRLFDREADGWEYCADVLSRAATKVAAAAGECQAKARVEVVS